MRRPIFIIGQMQRTGTNFLCDLVAAHPDTVTFAPVMEDHLLEYSDDLERYVDRVTRRWTPRWGVPEAESARLLGSLTDGLSRYVAGRDEEHHVVTKTPSATGLNVGEQLLESATILLLVRDGRDTVESIHNSFDWSYERAMRTWARSAVQVREFNERFSGHANYCLVRYEDLVMRPTDTIAEVLACCGLASADYDFAAVEDMPVRGSSTSRSGDDRVHWKAETRTDDFQPLKRAQSWDAKLDERFATLAGEASKGLGYPFEGVPRRSVSADLGYQSERVYNWGRRRGRSAGGSVLRKVRAMTQSTRQDRS